MFFLFPPVELGDDDNKTTISILDARDSDDGTTNIDFVNVTTTDEDGEELVTHFGIQGRSDHLAQAMGRREKKQLATEEAAA